MNKRPVQATDKKCGRYFGFASWSVTETGRLIWTACLAATLALSACGSDNDDTPEMVEVWSARDAGGIGPTRQDRFYVPPQPLAAGVPGEVIRSEVIRGFDPEGTVQATRILYHSTSIHGENIVVSGLVLLPPGRPPVDGWPILGWAHGTTGVGDACAPSKWKDFYEYGHYVLELARAGFVIAASDYEGLGVPGAHPYLDKSSEAHGVIDSVRAARLLLPNTSRRWLAIGHSQGGQAALAVAERATQWAPELEYVGTVGIAPASSLHLLPGLVFGPVRGYIAFFAAGLVAVNPDIELADLLGPAALEKADVLRTGCWYEVLGAYRNTGIAALMPQTPAGRSAAAAFFERNEPGTLPLGQPVLLVQGQTDNSVPLFVTRTLHERLCAAGENVHLSIYQGVGHDEVLAPSRNETITWMRARLAGEVADSDCSG